MNGSEFADVIKSCENVDMWRNDIIYNFRWLSPSDKLLVELAEKGYIIRSEDHYGGEGRGDEYWDVFSVENNGEKTYFRLNGWYASYEGATFDDPFDFEKVKKVPVQVFEWVVDKN